MSTKNTAYNLTMKQIGGNLRNLRYMTSVAIPGIYNILSHHYGLGRGPEVMEGMKDAFFDFIAEEYGYEPTFVDEEAMDWWTGLSDDYFTDKNYRGDISPAGELSFKKEYIFKGPLFED